MARLTKFAAVAAFWTGSLVANHASAITLQCQIGGNGQNIFQTIDDEWFYDDERMFREHQGTLITISRHNGALNMLGRVGLSGYCIQGQVNEDPNEPEPPGPIPSTQFHAISQKYSNLLAPPSGAQPPPFETCQDVQRRTGRPVPGCQAAQHHNGLEALSQGSPLQRR